MKRFLVVTLAAAWLGSAPVSRAAIDFTLTTKDPTAGGLEPSRQYITDGEYHIYLQIPRTWKATGSAGQLELVPPQASSQVMISQVPGVQALPLDTAGLDVLRKDAQKRLPVGATNVKVVGEIKDLLPVFNWKSFEVTFEYDFYGQTMRRSSLYVNMLPGRVVQVVSTAAVSDFEKVHDSMYQLMFNWFEPKRNLNPEAARAYESGEFLGS